MRVTFELSKVQISDLKRQSYDEERTKGKSRTCRWFVGAKSDRERLLRKALSFSLFLGKPPFSLLFCPPRARARARATTTRRRNAALSIASFFFGSFVGDQVAAGWPRWTRVSSTSPTAPTNRKRPRRTFKKKVFQKISLSLSLSLARRSLKTLCMSKLSRRRQQARRAALRLAVRLASHPGDGGDAAVDALRSEPKRESGAHLSRFRSLREVFESVS